jgi:hypothetical protein
MPLQSSSAISLNDIHVEAGGSSGTTATINDSDIRGLISKASGATMSFNEWYGASAGQDIVVTQGSATTAYYSVYGWNSSGPTGSRSPTTYTNSSSNSRGIEGIYRLTASSGTFFYVTLNWSTANSIPDNDFTSISMVCNGTTTTLLSSEASTTFIAGGYQKRWGWDSSNGLDSTELANINAEWDGSGNVTVTFTT